MLAIRSSLQLHLFQRNQSWEVLPWPRILSAWPFLLVTELETFSLSESWCISLPWTIFSTFSTSSRRAIRVALNDKPGNCKKFLSTAPKRLKFTNGFGFLSEWHINLRGLFNTKAVLVERQQWCYLIHSCRDKGVHTFPKCISLKVNVIERLEFELVYYDVTVRHFSHYTIGTTRSWMWLGSTYDTSLWETLYINMWSRFMVFSVTVITHIPDKYSSSITLAKADSG